MDKQRGFTLLELSMVVVIIGLIVGGVMIGRDLITSASYRAQISDINKLKAALVSFRLKYNCLPGDCREATRHFVGTVQPQLVTNGNGNRRIEITTASFEGGDQNIGWGRSNSGEYSEWASVFDHLAAANMFEFPQYDETSLAQGLGGAGIVCPELKFESKGGGGVVALNAFPPCMAVGFVPGYDYVQEGHKIALGAGSLGAGVSSGINPWEAEALDSKLDDGRPRSGQMVVMHPHYLYRLDSTYGCMNPSDNVYYTEKTHPNDAGPQKVYRGCNVYYNAGF